MLRKIAMSSRSWNRMGRSVTQAISTVMQLVFGPEVRGALETELGCIPGHVQL